MGNGGAVAAVIAARRRKIVDAFRRAGCVSPETARPIESIGVSPSRILDHLARRGVIRSTPDGRRWLDGTAADRDHRRRVVFALVLLVLIFLGLLAIRTIRGTG